MEVMVIYVWQCMVVLLYDCICARWLYIYIYIYPLREAIRRNRVMKTI